MGAGDDSWVNAGTLTIGTGGVVSFGDGNDLVNNGGLITLTGGSIQMGAGANSFINGGTIKVSAAATPLTWGLPEPSPVAAC